MERGEVLMKCSLKCIIIEYAREKGCFTDQTCNYAFPYLSARLTFESRVV